MSWQDNSKDKRVQVPCLDNFGCRYAVRLRVVPDHGEHGCVVLMLKLGETAWLIPDEARVLAEQLVLFARHVETQAAQRRQKIDAANAEAAAKVANRQANRGV